MYAHVYYYYYYVSLFAVIRARINFVNSKLLCSPVVTNYFSLLAFVTVTVVVNN